MLEFIITIESTVSYELLKDYHFTVRALWDNGNYTSYDPTTPYLFDLRVTADNKEEAELLVFNYLKIFNTHGAVHHIGNVVYITQALIEYEGSYIHTDAPKNDQALLALEPLLKLLVIKEEDKVGLINIEITSNKGYSNKEFEYHSKFTDQQFKAKIIDEMIATQFDHLKSIAHTYSFGINHRLNSITTPTLKAVSEMVDQASSVSSKAFKADFLYTVCLTILNYLNACSNLNPENRALTNDQARIIYATCKIHGLLSVAHDVENDALNYIRMVLKNKTYIEPLNAIIKEDLM